MGNLLAEFFGGTRRLLTGILVLLVAVYAYGFIIVNAYLWHFGITRLGFFHPPYIAAGLLFISFGIIAVLFVVPLLTLLISPLLELAHDLYLKKQNEKGKKYNQGTKSQTNQQDHTKRGVEGLFTYLYNAPTNVRPFFAGICIALAALTFFIIFPFLMSHASELVATLLGFAKVTPFPLAPELKSSLEIIVTLHGVAASFVLLLLNHRRQLGPIPLAVLASLATLMFLVVQTYTLLKVADKLYEELPVSAGGGQPANVILILKTEDEQLLEQLSIPYTALETPPTDTDDVSKTPRLFRTSTMQLIWQLNSGTEGAETSESLSTYVVRVCDICPAVEIRKALVHAMIHIAPGATVQEQP